MVMTSPIIIFYNWQSNLSFKIKFMLDFFPEIAEEIITDCVEAMPNRKSKNVSIHLL